MIRKICAIASLIACNAYAMEEISTHKVTTREEIFVGLLESNKMVDTMLKDSPLTAEQQQAYEQEYRAKRIEQILAYTNSENAFFKRGEVTVGFVATHPSPITGLIVIDKANLGTDPEHKQIILLECLKFIKQNYNSAEKAWIPLPRDNKGLEQFATQNGFTKSEYLDAGHDPKNCQGWERNLTE